MMDHDQDRRALVKLLFGVAVIVVLVALVWIVAILTGEAPR